MAQKVRILLIDDLDGSEASEAVSFAVDGVSYEIDLNDANAAELREAFARWIGHARRAGGRRAAGRRSGAGPKSSDIRAWARENGFTVSERGRIPAEVRDAYDNAH